MYMSGTAFNAVLTGIFFVLGFMVFYKYQKVKKYIEIPDRGSKFLRVGFYALMILSALTLITSHTWADFVRTAAMIFACSAYLMAHEGMGPEGVVKSNTFIPWSEVRNWDTDVRKNKFIVYLMTGSSGKTMTAETDAMDIEFSLASEQAVRNMLKKYAARKYTRMKKS